MRKSIPFVLVALMFLSGCDSKQTSHSSTTGPATQPANIPDTCQRAAGPVGGPLKIAVIPKGTTHEFWKAIHAGAVKAETELNDVQIEWKGPVKEDDRTEQVNIVENYIHPGTHGIVIAPLDDVALARPVREATRAGIGVVVVDSGLKAEYCTDFASFVATDNYAGGCKGADRLGEVLGGKGNVILMRYQEGSASTVQREQGFLDTMKARFPDIHIISSDQHGGATTESARTTAENLLNRFEKDVNGIFCPNESTTFGMLLALQGAGLEGDVKFVGFDSYEKFIPALQEGQLHGLVLQDPMKMGYVGVKTMVAYLRGEAVPSRVDTGIAVATPENINDPAIQALLHPPIDQYLP